MKTKNDLSRILFITTMLALFLGGCDFSKIKIGEVRMMYGANEEGHIAYNYETFTGIESGNVQVEKGQIISFEYAATVNRGSLMIEWQDPNGEVVWRKSLIESDGGNEAIIAESSGGYSIFIQGRNTSGEFDISWENQ